jgi:hypothetical protein
VKRRPSARLSASKGSSRSRKPSSTTHKEENDVIKTTKEDKRRMKHSTLISRIEKSNTRATKRRRPSKKLIANLESLLDALPEAPASSEHTAAAGDTRIRHKSLKSKPGAMKKKLKLEKSEMDRFSMNLAQMSTVVGREDPIASGSEVSPAAEAVKPSGSQRWAALRGFIEATLDRNVKTSS